MTSDTGRQAITTHPAVRIGDAEREHVAVTLGEHVTTGRSRPASSSAASVPSTQPPRATHWMTC